MKVMALQCSSGSDVKMLVFRAQDPGHGFDAFSVSRRFYFWKIADSATFAHARRSKGLMHVSYIYLQLPSTSPVNEAPLTALNLLRPVLVQDSGEQNLPVIETVKVSV